MVDRLPDYLILSGGGSIADLSGLDIEDPDRVVSEFLEKITRKVGNGQEDRDFR